MSAVEKIKTLENRISELEQENKRLHDSVDYLTHKLFGRSSEKTSALALGQISLFMKQKPKPIQKHRSLILKKFRITGVRNSMVSVLNS